MPTGKPFAKGQSGNPSGRPRENTALREMAREVTEEALAVMVVCLKSKSESIRLEAARLIHERGWGRPSSELDVKISSPIDTAARMAAELTALRQNPQTASALLVLAEASASFAERKEDET